MNPAALFELGEAEFGADVDGIAELDAGETGDEDGTTEVEIGATEAWPDEDGTGDAGVGVEVADTLETGQTVV